jgi:hypothetical protein
VRFSRFATSCQRAGGGSSRAIRPSRRAGRRVWSDHPTREMVTQRAGHFKARKQATRPGPGSAGCRPGPERNGGGAPGRGKLAWDAPPMRTRSAFRSGGDRSSSSGEALSPSIFHSRPIFTSSRDFDKETAIWDLVSRSCDQKGLGEVPHRQRNVRWNAGEPRYWPSQPTG